MSFYVTLPSNGADIVSEYGKMYNTQTDFQIYLNEPINLKNKNYEVGLSEFNCKLSWLFTLGKFKITNYDGEHVFYAEISCADRISVYDMVKMLKKTFKEINLNNETENEEKIIEFDYKNGLITIKVPHFFNLHIEGYLATLFSEYINTNPKEESKLIIRSENNIFMPGDIEYTCIIPVSRINYIDHLFVYTNIIENQFVGTEKVRLLRIIPVSGNYSENFTKIYDFPHYVGLDSHILDTIRIFLRDSEGNKIRFIDSHSRVVYKLHMKPINKSQ